MFYYWLAKRFSQNVPVHCVAALLSFGGLWVIWYEALAVLYCLNQWWGRCFFFAIYYFYFFCKLFAVTQWLFITFCSSVFSSVFLVLFFHFFGDKHFLFLYIFVIFVVVFFPSVQVDEKLLYFVYKNLGKQAFVKMKKKIKFVLFLLHPSAS